MNASLDSPLSGEYNLVLSHCNMMMTINVDADDDENIAFIAPDAYFLSSLPLLTPSTTHRHLCSA